MKKEWLEGWAFLATLAPRGLLGAPAPQDRGVALEFQERRGREDPQEPRGTKVLKDPPGLLRYPTSWGTKENRASKGSQEGRVKKETEASPDSRAWKGSKGHLDHRDHQAPAETLEALGILERQDPVVCREAWATWGCQDPKEKGELWDSQVYLEDQASQVSTVSKEIRESQVIQKVQGQDHQDQRENKDCQVTWGGKEKGGHLARPDTQGLLDLTEPLEVPEAPDPQETQVRMESRGLKARKASLDVQAPKALQAPPGSQEILGRWA